MFFYCFIPKEKEKLNCRNYSGILNFDGVVKFDGTREMLLKRFVMNNLFMHFSFVPIHLNYKLSTIKRGKLFLFQFRFLNKTYPRPYRRKFNILE